MTHHEYVANVQMMIEENERLWTLYSTLPAEDAVRNCNMLLEAEIDVILIALTGQVITDEQGWGMGVRVTMQSREECLSVHQKSSTALRQCFQTAMNDLTRITWLYTILQTAGESLFHALDDVEG